MIIYSYQPRRNPSANNLVGTSCHAETVTII
nr:MAG TPA: hypothetical protein [Caudoviricetes sp.]